MPKTFKDLTNKKIGNLFVIKFTGKMNHRNRAIWLCRCDCGNLKEMSSTILLRKGNHYCSTTCGYKLSSGRAAFNSLLKTYKQIAKYRKLSFNLTEEEFRLLINGNCYYCGLPPSQKMGGKRFNGDYIYNGIDRMDNTVGYNKDNCVSCCKVCNVMKNNLPLQDFYQHVTKIYNRIEIINGTITATDLTD